MARIKRKVLVGFTTVQNDYLRDRELGFTERGVLTTMLSLPDNWDFSAAGLASIVPDGLSKTNASLKKLEAAGYLKRQRVYENGKVVDWEYIFCDKPIFKANETENALFVENPSVETPSADYLPTGNQHVGNLQVENLDLENLHVENRADNINTKHPNTYESINLFDQSINPLTETSVPGTVTAEKKNVKDGWTEADNNSVLIDTSIVQRIKDQIEYDILIERMNSDEVDLAVSCIVDLYGAVKPRQINGTTYTAEFLQKRASEISSEHIEFVFDRVHERTDEIHNLKSYLTTAIFNAPDTMGTYITQQLKAKGVIK